jgi:chemotaxis protein methyltransferase CheR
MQLTRLTFDQLRQSILRLCGLVIADDKEYLVHDRLEPIVRRHGWNSFEQLADRLRMARSGELADEVIEAIVTRETSFFRDPHIFEALGRELLPRLIAGRTAARPQVRVWSAGTSTGQEAYSLAMLAWEFSALRPNAGRPSDVFAILATDICPSAVRAGQSGQYDARETARGISSERRDRFFEPCGTKWRVREPLRHLVEFCRVNLTEPLPALGLFDLICCRNVLIYFDEATRRGICGQFHAMLADNGFLLLGAAENLYGISDQFTSIKLSDALLYRKS